MNVLKAPSHPVLNLFLTTVQSGRRGSEPPLYRWGNQDVVHSFYVAELSFEPRISDFCPFFDHDSNPILTTLQVTSCPLQPSHYPSITLSRGPTPDTQCILTFPRPPMLMRHLDIDTIPCLFRTLKKHLKSSCSNLMSLFSFVAGGLGVLI